MSVVLTVVPAQGLTHGRCSVSVCGRKERRGEVLQSMREVVGRIRAIVPSFHL